MPTEKDLPIIIANLAYKQAAELRHSADLSLQLKNLFIKLEIYYQNAILIRQIYPKYQFVHSPT